MGVFLMREADQFFSGKRVWSLVKDQRLTKTFGGEYWKGILWDKSLTPAQREWNLIEKYADTLRSHLPYVGFCPVREAEDTRIKYFVVFASRHQDGLLLMNDIMAKAYYSHIHRQAARGGLWENTPWATTQHLRIGGSTIDDLTSIIEDTVKRHAGDSRRNIWLQIVMRYYMRFTESEYKNAVKALVSSNKLRCPQDPKTNRINNDCPLYPV